MNGLALQSEIPSLEISTSPCDRALEIILPAPQVGIWVVDRIGAWGDWRQRNTEFSWVTYVWPDGTIYYASDVKAYLEESWQAALGVPVVPVEAVALPEPEPEPEIKSGIKTVAEMADLMDMDRDELQRRLDARTYDYKFKVYPYFERDATGQKLNLTRNEYSFDKKQAAHNVKNRDIVKEVKQKK